MDSQRQLQTAHRCLAQAGALAQAQAAAWEGPLEWGQVAAALADARALLESGGPPGSWVPPSPPVSRQSCAELIWTALVALRMLTREQDWPQVADASRAALVALELVDRQPRP